MAESNRPPTSAAADFSAPVITGKTGSGKSSARPGPSLLRLLLQGGQGGLLVFAKPGERALFKAVAREAGRAQDLIGPSPCPGKEMPPS